MTLRTKETLQRIFSSIIALPVYAFFLITDHIYSLGVLVTSLVVSLACLFEFYQISKCKERGTSFIIPGIIAGALLNALVYMYAFGRVYGYHRFINLYDVRPVLAIFVLLTLVIGVMQVVVRSFNEANFSLSNTVFGLFIIVIPYSHIILMKALPDGIFYIFVLHIVIMLNDSFAYFGGVMFGSHKTGFLVSPNKSWEGYFSGMLFSIIAMVVSNEVLKIFFDKDLFSLLESILLGLLLSLLGNLGDLIESAIKRDADVKDSGQIIPGHGGMWDVFDSIVLAIPVFYYYLKLTGR